MTAEGGGTAGAASPSISRLVSQVAERLVDLVLSPPGGDEPLVIHRSPAELVDDFASTLDVALATDAAPAGTTELLSAIDLIISRSVTTSHPRFFNQNFAGPDPIAVIGDWLTAVMNTTAATFEAAPVFTMMENALLERLAAIAGYRTSPASGLETGVEVPPGLFCPGGSTAQLYALQLARHRQQPDLIRQGASNARLAVFVSSTGHYSAVKSAALLGLGTDAVIKVAVDHEGAMLLGALDQAIATAKADGRLPLAVIGTSGTTVTAAFDDLEGIAERSVQHGLWFHVDGCFGGSALLSPSHAHRLAGVEHSDSFVWNLHKMLGVTQQCTALLVREPQQLVSCFSTGADYLFQPDKLHGDADSGDRTFQCARRVDALKLWLTWKARGEDAFADRIDHAVELADHARTRVDADDRFMTVVAGTFTNLVFAWVPPEWRPLELTDMSADQLAALHRVTPAIKTLMQAEGRALLGFQPVEGFNAFRFIFMNPEVATQDVDAVLGLIDRYGLECWLQPLEPVEGNA